MNESALRVPPHNEEAERGVLGSILLDPLNCAAKAQNFGLKPEAFYDRRHVLLFERLMEMAASGKAMDSITIADFLEGRGEMDGVGGYDYLIQLQDATVVPAHVEHYANIVRQKYILRQIIHTSRIAEDDCYKAETGEQLLRDVPERFMSIVDEQVRDESVGDIVDSMMGRFELAAKGIKKDFGLEIRYPRLNDAMCGLKGYGMLAARPSIGKTTLEDCLVEHWLRAEEPIPVARLTNDMGKEDLIERMAARISGVSLPKMKKGYVKYESKQWDQMAEAAELIRPLPMFINSRDRNLNAICTWIRTMVMKHGVRVVTIDYIQQLRTGTKKDDWSTGMITEISGTLKALTHELGITMIVLSQLSRSPDKDNRKPTPADLRESGALEQDAEWIWMLYNDFKVEQTPTLRPVWVDVVKNKQGPKGGVPFWLYPNYFRFEEGNQEAFGDIEAHQGHAAAALRAEQIEIEL